jgi:DNA-binding FrmR family transcriptional regulator
MKSSTTKQAQRRINIIKGQLDGLAKMIAEDKYCVDVLNQSLAIQNSLKSLDALILEGHLETHVSHQFKTNDAKAVSELLTLYTRMKK